MKKIVFLFFLVIVSSNLFANEEPSTLDVALDLAYFDPFIDDIIYNEITFSLNVTSDFSLRIPLNVIFPLDNSIDIVGIGGSIDFLYRPLFNGIFVSFSLVKIEYLSGYDAPFENVEYLDKLSFGYTFKISNNFFIEPAISFFNLNGIYEDSIISLKDSFKDFPSIRASLLVGYKIVVFK